MACGNIMGSQGPDCEFILKVIEDKFDKSFMYFMGNGSLASSMYIDSELYFAKEQKTKSFDELYNDILTNDSSSRSNLILGDSGLGKTTLGLHICQRFWKSHEHNSIDIVADRIPIYIHLPSVIETLKGNILFRFVGENSALVDSLAKLKLLLILDGFDELRDRNQNIFKINKWGYPPYRDVRVVIFSRHEIPQSHKNGLFEFIQEGEPPPFATSDPSTYSEYVIKPFNSEQIDLYIDRFDKFILSKDEKELSGSVWEMTKCEYNQHGWSKAHYLKWFARLRDLRSLAESPLILSLLMQTLPRVSGVDPGSSETDILKKIQQFCKTKVGVFDGFTECWFYFQYKRLVRADRLTDFNVRWPLFKEFCYAFGQNVAYSMISRRKDESRGLLEENFVSNQFLDGKLLEVNGNDYSVSREIQSECVEILKRSKNIPELVEAVRIACLIKYSVIELSGNEKTFVISFFHRSLAEYFVSRNLFKGLAGELDFFLSESADSISNENLNEEEKVRGLNSYLIKEEGIILNLADRVKSDPHLQKTLFTIVDKSKNVSLISIMSANAISILNIAGISLSGHDFSWVQIPGANLNHSICGNTNFNGANLQNVSFENSWLFGAHFKGANFKGTQFGIIPNIPIDCGGSKNKVARIEIRQENKNWFLYGGNICDAIGCLKIIKWDLQTLQEVKVYRTTCSKVMADISYLFTFWNEKLLCIWRGNVILFELETGEVLSRVEIPTLENGESKLPWHGQVLGFADNQFHLAWGSEIKLFNIQFDRGTKNVLQLTCKEECTLYIPAILFDPKTTDLLRMGSKFAEVPKMISIVNNVDLGLVMVYGNTVQFIDKSFSMTFDAIIILAFDIDPTKRQIVITGPLGFMEIWSIDSKVRFKKLTPTSAFIKAVIFSPDSKYLVSGATDYLQNNSVTIWDNENDWSILNIIHIGNITDMPISFRMWSTNDGLITLAIPIPESIQLYPINKNEINLQVMNKIITQKKFVTDQHLNLISCSTDGNFIAVMTLISRAETQDFLLHNFSELGSKGLQGFKKLEPLLQCNLDDTKNILKESLRICNVNPAKIYSIQIYNTMTGTREYESQFSLDIGSEVSYMTFIVNNRIVCIKTTEDGTTFSLIYDLEGNIFKNWTEIRLPKCRFYSTEMNCDGTSIAFILQSGQIQLFKLTGVDPYIQEGGCIHNSSINSGLKPRFLSFYSSGIFLASASFEHGIDDRPIHKSAQIQIWNIQNNPMILMAKFVQPSFSLPMCLRSNVGSILYLFHSGTLSSYQEDFNLFAVVNQQNNNIVKISEQLKRKYILEIYFWFKIKILKFIPQDAYNKSSTKFVVSDQINMCCINITSLNEDNRRPSWSVLWSFCSKVDLVVKELSLNGCISLDENTFHSLRRLGANPDGWMACDSQEYISKSNLICPILGSSDLPSHSILSCERNEYLSPSNDNWILSVIGKKSRVPILRGVAEVKVVSHVFFALEGLRRDRRFIIEAHLYVTDSKAYFVLRPVSDLERFREEHEGSSIKQWYRTQVQGEALLEDILLDYQNNWKYKFLTHNCVKWCKRKLKNNEIIFKSRIWDKVLMSPSAVLGRERVM